jgi:hypothetical protein
MLARVDTIMAVVAIFTAHIASSGYFYDVI